MNFDNDERFEYSYFSYNTSFFKDLCQRLQGLRVLEVFAGNGKLASLLQEQGIHVTATSLHSGHDGHHITGFFTDVEHIDAVSAVQKYGQEHDILLMCWPTVTDAALQALQAFGKPVLFIGEVSNVNQGLYGGCATDAFFEHIHIIETLDSYKGNYLEKAFIAVLK